MKYEAIRKNEKQFTALTGLSVEEFGRLTETFAPKCDQVSEESTFDGKIRTCRYSSQGGRAYNHTRKVVFTPKYCKNHFTQEAQAAVFGIKGDLGNNSIKLLHPISLFAPCMTFGSPPKRIIHKL